jgi:YVTN family beta-propeller protein
MRFPASILSLRKARSLRFEVRAYAWVPVLLLAAAGLGCGDTFRPIAQPIPLPSPSPAQSHFVSAISSNGPLDPGAVSRIDVAGDSFANSFATGVAPVHAAYLPNGSKLYIANSGENTVTSTSTTGTTTISLPQLCSAAGCSASVPVFVTSTENSGTINMYVANSGNGTVSVINTTSDVVVASVAVNPAFAGSPLPVPNPAADPVALVELPNPSAFPKVYSVNQGDSTVTSISTVDDTVLTVIPIGAPPIWAVASPDSAFVYVLDTSGTVSVINTLSDTVVATTSVGAGANFMFYDNARSRLFITNPTAATLSIFTVSGATLTPTTLTPSANPLTITAAPGLECVSAPVPTSVNVLVDGSKAYVASYQADANGTVCTQATVVDFTAGAKTSSIPLAVATQVSSASGCAAARFRVFATSAAGSANSNLKVYISQCDAGSVAVIDTFASSTGTNPHPADVLQANMPSPLSSFPATQVSISGGSVTSATTTYNYSLLSGNGLQVGNTITLALNNPLFSGPFAISSLTPTTFTVATPVGITSTSTPLTGTGTAVLSQNPVFVAAGQ